MSETDYMMVLTCFKDFYLEEFLPDFRHVHEHDPGVNARLAIVRVAGKTVVPSNPRLLVLWSHGSQVAGIEPRQQGPDVFYWLQK